MPFEHSSHLFSSHLSARTISPTRYSVSGPCSFVTPYSAPTTSTTFAYSARHFRPVELLRFAALGTGNFTITLFLHFFQPIMSPSGTMVVTASAISLFLAALRSASRRLAARRSAARRLAALRSAALRSAALRSAALRSAARRLASRRLAARTLAALRSAALRSAALL